MPARRHAIAKQGSERGRLTSHVLMWDVSTLPHPPDALTLRAPPPCSCLRMPSLCVSAAPGAVVLVPVPPGGGHGGALGAAARFERHAGQAALMGARGVCIASCGNVPQFELATHTSAVHACVRKFRRPRVRSPVLRSLCLHSLFIARVENTRRAP